MITCTALAIGLHIGTYHFDREHHYNDFNPGIYASCDGWVAGVYRNSERKDDRNHTSVWAGKQFDKVIGDIDITVGLATGYIKKVRDAELVMTDSCVSPAGAKIEQWSLAPAEYKRTVRPMVTFSYRFDSGVRATLLPPVSKHGGGVHLSWEF